MTGISLRPMQRQQAKLMRKIKERCLISGTALLFLPFTTACMAKTYTHSATPKHHPYDKHKSVLSKLPGLKPHTPRAKMQNYMKQAHAQPFQGTSGNSAAAARSANMSKNHWLHMPALGKSKSKNQNVVLSDTNKQGTSKWPKIGQTTAGQPPTLAASASKKSWFHMPALGHAKADQSPAVATGGTKKSWFHMPTLGHAKADQTPTVGASTAKKSWLHMPQIGKTKNADATAAPNL